MTAASELFGRFEELWHAGKNARLNMECYAGQAWLSLHIHLPHQPPHQPHLQRRQGPSRLRRRARREAARKSGSAAVKAAAASESIPDVSTSNAPSPDINSAEEAGNDISPAIPAANKMTPPAEKADPSVSPAVKPDHGMQAPPKLQDRKHQLNVLARSWPIPSEADHHVRDEMCSDQDYRQQSSPSPQPLAPPNQCELCGKSFGSSRALNNHVTRNHEPTHL